MRATVLTLDDPLSGVIHIALDKSSPCVPSTWEHTHCGSLKNSVLLLGRLDSRKGGRGKEYLSAHSRDRTHMPGEFSTTELHHQTFNLI